MSKFHTTISRRNFMKGLGLAGAGLGAAAAAAPVFHDLDELTASATHPQFPWWVSERDDEDPTTEIDWDVFQAFDRNKNPMSPSTDIRAANLVKAKAEALEGVQGNIPGRGLREVAMATAARGFYGSNPPWTGAESRFTTPESQGATGPWQDTPENNLQSLRAVMHLAGCNKVGAIEVTEHSKRLFDANTTVWEDIPEAFRDESGVYHIPNKCRWILTFAAQQNYIQSLYGLHADDSWPGGYGFRSPWLQQATFQAYSTQAPMSLLSSRFIKSLGYQTWQPPMRINVALGALSGVGEQGRTCHLGAPDRGLLIRRTYYWVTDLPLAPTKPIDFGFRRFCENCKTCGGACPSGAISMETEPYWEPKSTANRPGIKTWYLDWQRCRDFGSPGVCGICHVVCPFNKPAEAFIHTIVQSTSGYIGPLDNFYAKMDELMGYQRARTEQEQADWWTRDLRTYKGDAILNAGKYNW